MLILTMVEMNKTIQLVFEVLYEKDLLGKPCRHWWTKDGLEEVKTMHRENRLGGSYGKEVVDDLQVWPLVQFT